LNPTARRFIKTAIAFLGLGLAIGLWMIVDRELRGRYPVPHAVSAHTHAILVGFVMMVICGVAAWMFPRPVAGDARYRPAQVEAAYWLLTIGTAARVGGELARALTMSGAATLRWTIVVGGAAQVVGLAAFFHTMWWRIRASGAATAQRENREGR